MEDLIKQAFLHVDVIGPHVHEGHYDLVGPDGEIILPQIWETMVQPDWTITMHMWPMPEPPPPRPPPQTPIIDVVPGPPPKVKGGKTKNKKRESAHHNSPPYPTVMMDPMPPPPPPPPPPPSGPGPAAHPMHPTGAGIEILPAHPPPSVVGSSRPKKKSAPSPFMKWAAGGTGSGRSSSVKKAKKPS